MEFPFRRETFIVSANKAMVKLGWRPQFSLAKDIKAEIETYIAQGGLVEKWAVDKELRYDMEILASKDMNFMFNYPMFDDIAVDQK